MALQNGDYDAAKALDDVRVGFLRELSKCPQKMDIFHKFGNKIENIYYLDKKILSAGERLRDEVLTDMKLAKNDNDGCVQYVKNQNL